MKIDISFTKRILLIGSLGFFISCMEPFPELPAETQSGAGSFGCLVNNELVYAWYSSNRSDAGAAYNVNINQLQISAICQFGQQFFLIINNPYKNQDTLIDTIRYLPPNSNNWIEATQSGSFRITRMDSISSGLDVVSGSFFFDLNENGKTPIHVTKGRFDLNLFIY